MHRDVFFLCFFLTSIVIYFISDYFFNDTVLYLIGGFIGGFAHIINIHSNMLLVVIWIIILLSFITLFNHSKNRIIKYLSLLLIAVLLYVFDLLFYKIFIIEIWNLITKIFIIGVRVLSKGLILTGIIYIERQKRLRLN